MLSVSAITRPGRIRLFSHDHRFERTGGDSRECPIPEDRRQRRTPPRQHSHIAHGEHRFADISPISRPRRFHHTPRLRTPADSVSASDTHHHGHDEALAAGGTLTATPIFGCWRIDNFVTFDSNNQMPVLATTRPTASSTTVIAVTALSFVGFAGLVDATMQFGSTSLQYSNVDPSVQACKFRAYGPAHF